MTDRPSLFIKKGRPERVPLLFGYEVDEDMANVLAQDVLQVTVTPELRAAMERILADARNLSGIKRLSLPVAALRARIAFVLPRLVSMHPLLALSPFRSGDKSLVMLSLDGAGHSEDDELIFESQLLDALDHWLAHDLSRFCQAHGGQDLMAEVRALLRPSRAVSFSRGSPSLLGKTGQLQNPIPLLSQLAERLAGRELFKGLGPVYRLHTPDSPQTNRLDLLTRPIPYQASKSTTLYWSACARLEIQTRPFHQSPVLIARPIKVVWQHKVPPFVASQRSASGVVFPAAPVDSSEANPASGHADTDRDDPDSVYNVDHSALEVRFRRGKKGWDLPDEFDHIWTQAGGRQSHFPDIAQVKDVVSLGACRPGQAWAGMRYSTRFGNRRVPSTMLELDEQNLFEAVGRHAGGLLGEQVKGRSVRVLARSDQGMPRFKPADVFAALASEQGAQDWMSVAEAYGLGASIERIKDRQAKGHTATKRNLVSEPSAMKRIADQTPVNIEALLSHHKDENDASPPRLVIIADPPYADLIKGVARVAFGESLAIETMSLPAGVHGLSETIDGEERPKKQARFERRVAAWKAHAEAVKAACPEGAYVLICARKLYRNKAGRLVADDPVNYWAGHHVFPAVAKANVHYLLPWDDEGAAPDGSTGAEKQYQDFVYRTHSALMDLLLGHNAHLHEVPQHTQKHFQDWQPRFVLALTRVSTRGASGRAGAVCVEAALRLDVVTGMTLCRFGYSSRTRPIRSEITEWMPFRKGLVWLASNLNINSATTWSEQTRVTQEFLKTVLKDADQSGEVHLVTPYGNLLRAHWPWLRDGDLSAENIRLGDAEHLEQEFSNLVFARIRDGESPRLRMEVRSQYQQLSSHGNPTARTVTDAYLTTNKHLLTLATPTEVTGEGGEGKADTTTEKNAKAGRYFIGTMGYPDTVQVKRGGSGFRETSRMGKAQKAPGFEGDSELTIETETGQSETVDVFTRLSDPVVEKDISLPGSLEIVVLNAPGVEDADRIASFLMGLRSGFPQTATWTSLPAPLFYQRRIADYLVGFELAEAEDAGENFDDQGYEDLSDEAASDPPAEEAEDVSGASPAAHQISETLSSFRPTDSASGLNPIARQPAAGFGAQHELLATPSMDMSASRNSARPHKPTHRRDPSLLEDGFAPLWKLSPQQVADICFERRALSLPAFYTREMFDRATQVLGRSKRLQSAILDRIHRHDVLVSAEHRYLTEDESSVRPSGLIDLMWSRRNELFFASLIDELLLKKKRSKRLFAMTAYHEAESLLLEGGRLHGLPRTPLARIPLIISELADSSEHELMARLGLETFMTGSVGISKLIYSLLKEHDAEPIDQAWEYAIKAGELIVMRSQEKSARRVSRRSVPDAVPIGPGPSANEATDGKPVAASAPANVNSPAVDVQSAEQEQAQTKDQAQDQAPSVQEDTRMHQPQNPDSRASDTFDGKQDSAPSEDNSVTESGAASSAAKVTELREKWDSLKIDLEKAVAAIGIDQDHVSDAISGVIARLDSMQSLAADYDKLRASHEALSTALRDLLSSIRGGIEQEGMLSEEGRLRDFLQAAGRPDPEQMDDDRLEVAYSLALALQASIEIVAERVAAADSLMREMRRGGASNFAAKNTQMASLMTQAHENVTLAAQLCEPLLALGEAGPERLSNAKHALARHLEQGGQGASSTESGYPPAQEAGQGSTDQKTSTSTTKAANSDGSAHSPERDVSTSGANSSGSGADFDGSSAPDRTDESQKQDQPYSDRVSDSDQARSSAALKGNLAPSVHEAIRQEAGPVEQDDAPPVTDEAVITAVETAEDAADEADDEAAASVEEGEVERNRYFEDDALMVSTASRLVLSGQAAQAVALAEVYKIYHESQLQSRDLGHAPLMVYYAMAYAEYSAQAQVTESDDHRVWHEALSRFEIQDTLQAKAVLAAILRPGFFTPFGTAMCTPGLEGRLGADTPLDLLFKDVQALAQQGCVLRPELLRKAEEEGRQSWEQTREHMIHQCHHWGEQEDIHRGFSYSPASKLWIEIMSIKHPVGAALSKIKTDQPLEKQLSILQPAIDFLADDVDDIIKKWRRDRKNIKPIKYLAREQIKTNLERTLDHLQQLKAHLNDDPERSSGAHVDRMMAAADKIKGRMEDAVTYLKEGGSGSGIEKAVNASLLHVMESLLEEYRQPRELRRQTFTNYLEEAWLQLPITPEPKTPTRPDWSGCQDAVSEFLVSESPAPEDLVDWHITNSRFFSARLCLKRGLCPDRTDAEEALLDALTHQRDELDVFLDDAKDQIQKASLLSIISDAKKSEYQGKVQFISGARDDLPATGDTLVNLERLFDPTTPCSRKLLDFEHAQQEIDGLIINPLEQAIESEREAFQGKLRDEEDRMEPRHRPQIEEIRRMVASGGTTALITAQEMLTFVRSDMPIPTNRESNARLNTFTRLFLPEVERHMEASEDSDLIGTAIEMLQDEGQENIFGIPVSRADRPAVISALNAWLGLFSRDKDAQSVQEAVGHAVSEGLGIKFQKIKTARDEYKLLNVDLKGYASADVFIMPEFASKAYQTGLMVSVEMGVANYDKAIKALNAKDPGFALLHTFLDAAARSKLAENVRREASARIIVDDALALFSVLNFSERESTLLMVGQAFIKTTPYFTGTPMNMETFYGRREDMRELARIEPKLVYGGRRLGKSSLLAQHCEQTHDPSLLRYCCMVDCQNHSNEKDVLDELRAKLSAVDIVSARANKGTRAKPIRDGIIREMRAWLDGNSERRLELLLDEADKLIASDMKEDYPLIRSLQVMHQDYRNRFRYVLAGTHNAMRLDQSQNTPLGHMTNPICVRPFAQEDRFDGIRLVTQPLAALGFVFDDPQDEAVSNVRGSWLPFEILATANYFPAVIQILCDSLLDHLYQQNWRGLPPYRITAAHVRAVAESNNVRQKLQDKFKKTFHLDKRYELIAGILANQYYESRGEDQAMTAEDVREMCIMFAPNLFPSAAQHIISSYLVELVELSIIVRDDHGRYMLRSPNIAHYMGTAEEVENIIGSMENEPAPEDVDEKQRRGTLPNTERCFPLTLRQTVGIARSDHRVVVIVGSPANGVDEIKPALDSGFLQEHLIAQTVRHQSGNSSQTLKHVAVRFPRQASKRDSKDYRLASVDYIGQEVAWDMAALSQLARETQGKATNRVVLIVAGPAHAAEMLAESGSMALDEIQNMAVEAIMPWTEETLRLFGRDAGLDHLARREKRVEIMSLTGGLWPLVEDVARATAVVEGEPEATADEALQAHPLNALDLNALLSKFGLSGESEPALVDIAMTQDHVATQDNLEAILASDPLTKHVKDVRYLEWMGVFQIDSKGQHVLNPWLANRLERIHA